MSDRENTIERIERILELTHKESITVTIPRLAAERAVSMLKEQEPVVPQKHYNNKADLFYACGKCRNDLKPNNRNAKFCWFCGQAVKWK